MIGAEPIDAMIDPSSQFVLQRSSSCSTPDLSIFELAYGSLRFEIDFRISGGPSVFADKTYSAPVSSGSALVAFSTTPSSATASVTVGITGVLGRRDGSFHVVFADGSAVDGDFELPLDARGSRPHCGSSGGGDHFPDD